MLPSFRFFRSGDHRSQRLFAPICNPCLFGSRIFRIHIFPVNARRYQYLITRFRCLRRFIDRFERSFFTAVAFSCCRDMAATVGLSKLRALDHPEERLLSLPEALYLATKGPGEFFGKVGSFEPGYDFDALVVDVDELDGRLPRTPFEKLEQFLYDGDDRDILARYSRGSLVEKPFTE